MSRFRIIARTKQELDRLAFPERANAPEAIPYVFYDTQLYTSAATVTMPFFTTPNADRSMSNMETAGALPDPQYFEVQFFGADILIDASLGALLEVGALDDLQKLLLVSRSRFTFTMASKSYGPVPLSFLHGSGGATGVGFGTATAGVNNIQVGNNGIFDGGYYVGGAIVIPPKVGFSMQLDFAAAQTLNAGNVNIRLWMHGTWHRRVL